MQDHEPRDDRAPLETGKGRDVGSPLEPPEGSQPCGNLEPSEDQFLTSGLWNWEKKSVLL